MLVKNIAGVAWEGDMVASSNSVEVLGEGADCKFAKFNNLYSAADIGTKCQQAWTPSPSSPPRTALPSSCSPSPACLISDPVNPPTDDVPLGTTFRRAKCP